MQTELAADRRGITISVVSSLLGIPGPTIRSWERRFGFPSPRRTVGGHRRYRLDEVDRIAELRDELSKGRPLPEAIELVQGRSAPADSPGARLVDAYLAAALGLDQGGVRDVLERSVQEVGVEATVRDVVFPAERALGTGWSLGLNGVAHEHSATEAVRSWLGMTRAGSRPQGPPWVVACGPSDTHSLGAEALATILAERGVATMLLGARTPPDALRTAADRAGVRGVVVVSHVPTNRRAAVQALRAIEDLPIPRRYAGNAFLGAAARRGVPGDYLGDDIVVAADALASASA